MTSFYTSCVSSKVTVAHKEKENLATSVCLCPHTPECPLGMHLPRTLSWMLETGGGPGRDKVHSMERLVSQLRVQRSAEGFLNSEKAKTKDPKAGACPGSQSWAAGI